MEVDEDYSNGAAYGGDIDPFPSCLCSTMFTGSCCSIGPPHVANWQDLRLVSSVWLLRLVVLDTYKLLSVDWPRRLLTLLSNSGNLVRCLRLRRVKGGEGPPLI